jgi:hypothetical protein
MSLDTFMKKKKKAHLPKKRKLIKVPGGRRMPRKAVEF